MSLWISRIAISGLVGRGTRGCFPKNRAMMGVRRRSRADKVLMPMSDSPSSSIRGSELASDFTVSLDIDRRMYREDIAGSIAHAEMLGKQGIVSGEDVEAIIGGLRRIREEIEAGEFEWKPELEDIHINVEARLYELIGDAAGRLAYGSFAKRPGGDGCSVVRKTDRLGSVARSVGVCRERCWIVRRRMSLLSFPVTRICSVHSRFRSGMS